MHRPDRYVLWALLAAVVAAGCEPTSITEARTQLRRGGARVTSISLPIARDTFAVSDFLDSASTTTTSGGLVGIAFQTDSLSINIGTQLQFNNLAFDPFSFSFDQMLQTAPVAVSVSAPAPPVFAAEGLFRVSGPAQTFATPGGSTVGSATAGTGTVTRSIVNNTGCAVTGFTSSLLDGTNATVFSFPARNLPASATPAVDVVLIDTIPGGVTFSSTMKVDVPVPNFGACVPTPGAQVATSVSFGTMTLTQVTLQNVNEGFNQTFNAFAGEPRLTAVDTVVVASGSFSLTVQNRLPIADTITVRLNGITKAGVVQQQTLAVPAANGTGGYSTGTLVFDLTGARIAPAAVIPQVTGTAKAASATITPTNATNAALVSGGGSIVVQSLTGKLDPLKTPELSVANENTEEFTRAQIDLGDFEDAVKQSHLNDATASLTIVNGSGVPFSLNNFKLGLVRLDAAGQPIRLPGGALDFEKDGAGNQVLVAVVDPGQSKLTLARNQTKTVALPAALLIDSLVHKLLNNSRVALGLTGGTTIGDGLQATISRTDVIKVRFGLTIGLDITIPVAGVLFTRNQVTDGMDIKDADADELASRLDKATASARITNGTPFGVTVQIALARDSLASTVDVFTLPACTGTPGTGCRVTLDSVVLRPSTVNAAGQVVTPATDSVAVSLTGANSRVLFGKKITAGIRIRLLPGTGGGGRGAIRPADQLIVNAKAVVDIKAGGG